MKLKGKFLLLWVIFMFLLSACSDTKDTSSKGTDTQKTPEVTRAVPTPRSTPPPDAQAKVDGYLHNEERQIIWVQWTENAGQLNGTWHAAIIGADAHKITYTDYTLTGTHEGDTIKLTLTTKSASQMVSGTLKNNYLTLEMRTGGQVKHLEFQGVKQEEYDQALNELKTKFS